MLAAFIYTNKVSNESHSDTPPIKRKLAGLAPPSNINTSRAPCIIPSAAAAPSQQLFSSYTQIPPPQPATRESSALSTPLALKMRSVGPSPQSEATPPPPPFPSPRLDPISLDVPLPPPPTLLMSGSNLIVLTPSKDVPPPPPPPPQPCLERPSVHVTSRKPTVLPVYVPAISSPLRTCNSVTRSRPGIFSPSFEVQSDGYRASPAPLASTPLYPSLARASPVPSMPRAISAQASPRPTHEVLFQPEDLMKQRSSLRASPQASPRKALDSMQNLIHHQMINKFAAANGADAPDSEFV
jgi:hypothetical protein